MKEVLQPSYKNQQRHTVSKQKKILLVALVSIFIITVLIKTFLTLTTPPVSESEQTQFEVDKGLTVRDIAAKADLENIVRSEFLLYAVLTYFYDPTNIYAGTYIFSSSDDVFDVAYKLARNEVKRDLISITIPEGVPLSFIAAIAERYLPAFSTSEYLSLTKEKEGYLFPETYFVPKTFTASDLIELQSKTYEQNIAPLRTQIEQSPLSEYEVLILASIVEREANDEESMRMVSGVLQNRLRINMALQADASIEYALDKPLSELTAEDLKIDTPYNTYLYPGLVPTPIGNPGIMAIEAVLNATSSDYFYYLTDNNGIFRYAKTFAEHKRNIDKYLR